jgi:hypothetical protein
MGVGQGKLSLRLSAFYNQPGHAAASILARAAVRARDLDEACQNYTEGSERSNQSVGGTKISMFAFNKMEHVKNEWEYRRLRGLTE